jgi:hypothetical protein
MNRTDVALVSALWWPYAPYDELSIVNHLATWVCNLVAILAITHFANEMTYSFVLGMMVRILGIDYVPSSSANLTQRRTRTNIRILFTTWAEHLSTAAVQLIISRSASPINTRYGALSRTSSLPTFVPLGKVSSHDTHRVGLSISFSIIPG